jgi:hypothetical protein
MRRSILVVCALLAGTTLGCDKIKQAIDKRRNANKPAPAHPAARDTTKKPLPAQTTPGAQAGAKPAPVNGAKPAPATGAAAPPAHAAKPTPALAAPGSAAAPTPARTLVEDEPYDSADTGTIAPGMAVKDVEALWGPPAALRRAGTFTYLLYPNGCEHTCGTEDVVILQNDQVVDAILRWSGHRYSGESSSPPGKKPEPTLP